MLRIFILVAIGLALPSFAWASDASISERLPLVSLGLSVFLFGLVIAQALTSWWDLTRLGKLRRYLGAFISGIGVFWLVFASTETPPSPDSLDWEYDLEAAKVLSEASQKPILVDFWAEWCAACNEMESEVFRSSEVRPRLEEEFILFKVDFDQDTPQNRELIKEFRVSGLPTVGFYDPNGSPVENARFEGKMESDEFLEKLDIVRTGKGGSNSGFGKELDEKGLWAALLLVFLAGVASSFTPCVYPLIPITISLFGARDVATRREGFALSLVYVLGIVLTYSVMGLGAAALGGVFGGAMQSPIVVVGISVLFFVLALSSLGLFEIKLPAGLQTKLGQTGKKGYFGALLMGLVAGLIAAPCVGPIVAGILVWVAQEQDLLMGWLFLSVFALGMGQLFILLGTFSSMISKLPKSGPWMETVKVVFATIFVGMTIYYLRLVIPLFSDLSFSIWEATL